MANKITDTKYYSAIADAIRAKNGSSDTYYPADMAQAIEDIPSGGIDEDFAALLAGQGIGDIVVRGVERLNCAAIFFSNNSTENGRVTSLEFPDLIMAVPSSTTKSGFLCYAYSANNVASMKFPICTSLYISNYDNSSYANSFTNLTTLLAPQLTSLQGILRGAKLTNVEFPLLTYIASGMFSSCTQMIYADVGLITTVNALFTGCSSLQAVILRSTTMASLSSTGAFSNTPIASGTGYIYVPRSLISAYEAATNWSTYAGQFRALEDYTDDGTITGKFIMPAN